MLISERYRYIYIGIPRTGSRSARNLLGAVEGRDISDNKLYLLPGHRDTINHATALQTRELNRDIWDSYFKFAVVRNPWDRVLSWYAGLAPHKKGGPFDQWLLNDLGAPRAEPVSAAYHYDQDQFEKKVPRDTLEDYWMDYLLPCAAWVTDDRGDIIVDQIARFENFSQDWARICDKLGIDATLPHANASQHEHYSAYYTDEMKSLVAGRFKQDIEMFGYAFERVAEPEKASSTAGRNS